MKCLLDMDGVLADFIEGAVKLHGLPAHPYDDPKMHGVWDFIPSTGMTEEEFWKPTDQKFWAELEPTEECFKLVEFVEDRFGRDNVCLLTSPCLNHECIPGKMEWIAKYLPDYKRRFLAGPRKEFCAHSGAVLIDDNDHNTAIFSSHGGLSVMVPRRWNRLHRLHTVSLDEVIRYTDMILRASKC